MNIKKAIEFMENEVNYMTYAAFKCPDSVFEAQIFERKRKDIIRLLKENEKYKEMWNDTQPVDYLVFQEDIKYFRKYKKMWEEFESLYGFKTLYWAWEKLPKTVKEAMGRLKEKYFPDKKEGKAINEMEKMIKEGQTVIKELTDTLLFVKRKWDLKDK